MEATLPGSNAEQVQARFYTAREVAKLLVLAVPTVYELARTDPVRLGAERYGRAVRFRRCVIDDICKG